MPPYIFRTLYKHCGYHSYKHVYEGGRRGGKLVYSCGENGDCPPRRSAHRSWVVGPSFAVGGRGKGQGASLPLSPTTNEGFSPHLQWVRGARHLAPPTHHKWGSIPSFVVGERGKMPAPLTHRKWGKNPSFVVGGRGKMPRPSHPLQMRGKSLICGGWEGKTPPCPLAPPTHRKWGTHPSWGVGPPARWADSVFPRVSDSAFPPVPFDTLVTGMVLIITLAGSYTTSGRKWPTTAASAPLATSLGFSTLRIQRWNMKHKYTNTKNTNTN